jgi:hypothetical protein
MEQQNRLSVRGSVALANLKRHTSESCFHGASTRETIVCFAVLESYGRIMSSNVSVIEVEHGVGPKDLILLAASPDITMGLGGKLSHSCPRPKQLRLHNEDGDREAFARDFTTHQSYHHGMTKTGLVCWTVRRPCCPPRYVW